MSDVGRAPDKQTDEAKVIFDQIQNDMMFYKLLQISVMLKNKLTHGSFKA